MEGALGGQPSYFKGCVCGGGGGGGGGSSLYA